MALLQHKTLQSTWQFLKNLVAPIGEMEQAPKFFHNAFLIFLIHALYSVHFGSGVYPNQLLGKPFFAI